MQKGIVRLAVENAILFGLTLGFLMLAGLDSQALGSTGGVNNAKFKGWLHLYTNELELLLPDILHMQHLTHLDLSGSYDIEKRHIDALRELKSLRMLDLSNCALDRLPHLPKSLAELSGLEVLRLRGNGLKSMSDDILLALQNLEELDLSQNPFVSFPEGIASLNKLQSLKLSFNKIASLPETFGKLQQLRKLDLSNGRLNGFPEILLKLTNLNDLDLSYNQEINKIPESIDQLKQLQALNIRRCNLEQLPVSICNLSQLTKLCVDSDTVVADTNVSQSCLKAGVGADCPSDGSKIAIVFTPLPPHLDPSNEHSGQLERKSALLIAIIDSLIQKTQRLRIDKQSILDYETHNGFHSAEAKSNLRFALLDFLFYKIAAPENNQGDDTVSLLEKFDHYSRQNPWIKSPEGGPIKDSRKQQVSTSQLDQHTLEVLRWQLQSSKIIFWVVITIVCIGVGLAVVQFVAALKVNSNGHSQTEGNSHRESGGDSTEIELSLQSIKVKTSLIGVMVLIVSLGFFYLYLLHVYPIKPIG
jgi:hypothetical protein